MKKQKHLEKSWPMTMPFKSFNTSSNKQNYEKCAFNIPKSDKTPDFDCFSVLYFVKIWQCFIQKIVLDLIYIISSEC